MKSSCSCLLNKSNYGRSGTKMLRGFVLAGLLSLLLITAMPVGAASEETGYGGCHGRFAGPCSGTDHWL
jgi:hypothetical protein